MWTFFFTKYVKMFAEGSSRWHGSCWAQRNILCLWLIQSRLLNRTSERPDGSSLNIHDSQKWRIFDLCVKLENYWNLRCSGIISSKLRIKLKSRTCSSFTSTFGLKQKLMMVVKPQQLASVCLGPMFSWSHGVKILCMATTPARSGQIKDQRLVSEGTVLKNWTVGHGHSRLGGGQTSHLSGSECIFQYIVKLNPEVK